MGFFSPLVFKRVPAVASEVRLMVATGFLGAYTTFSTYGRAYRFATLYWAGSAILGVIAVQLGVMIARLGK
jgi:CrcB protein